MQSAINIAHSQAGSDGGSPLSQPPPPTSEALAPRAPWLTDFCSSVCLKCSQEFGVFHRRHHCRACGGLFCDKCSETKVKGVPGYDPAREERVCDICYYNDIAIVVVWNLLFSGWHLRYFGSYTDALKCYDSISDYASRVVLKVGTGHIYQSYFKNDHWKQRVMDYAYTQIRKVLPPRIPLLWHDPAASVVPGDGSGASNLNIPATLMRSQYRQPAGQQQQPRTPTNEAASVPPLPVGAGLQAPRNGGSRENSPRPADHNAVQHGVLVVYRQVDGEATDHTWLFFPYASKIEVLEEAGRFLRAIPRLSYGGVLDLDGYLHHFMKAPEAQGAVEAFHQLFKTYLENVSVMCVVATCTDVPPSQLMRGTASGMHATYFTKVRPALDVVSQNNEEATATLILDMAGNIVLSKGCVSAGLLDAMAKRAGAEVCKQQSLSALIACGPNDTSHVFEDMYTARVHMSRSTGFALFAVPESSTVPVLMQRHIYMTKDQALILKSAAMNKTKSLVSRQRIVIPESESSASIQMMAKAPECGICFLSYDVDTHKPCLCGKCGNSMCFTCIRSVSLCPFCRMELPVNGPYVTNVQLLQLLTGSTD